MRAISGLLKLLTITALSLAVAQPAGSQSWGDRLKKKAEEAAKKKIEDRTEKRAGEGTDKALDKIECAATDQSCKDKQAAVGVSQNGATRKPGEGAWANYDFVPGDRVLYYEDYTNENVGDFPRRLQFKSGSFEIVEWQGARFLRATSDRSRFVVPLTGVLPERFTLEFDFAGHITGGGLHVTLADEKQAHLYFIGVSADGANVVASAGVQRPGGNSISQAVVGSPDAVVHARVMADGPYVKVYLNETRVANVPNADLGRSKGIIFDVPASAQEPILIGPVRVSAGGRELYDALLEKGRVVTQGILFDTGSDRLRPESTPTLKMIGKMLEEHPDLRLTIEGHTDNLGDPAANQALSERRAAAVRQFLVSTYDIAAERLSAKGYGASRPVSPNTTPEGRQNNRRVELVKM